MCSLTSSDFADNICQRYSSGENGNFFLIMTFDSCFLLQNVGSSYRLVSVIKTKTSYCVK